MASKILTSVILIYLLIAYTSIAQNKDSIARAAGINFMINEKIRMTPEQLESFINTGKNPYNDKAPSKNNEKEEVNSISERLVSGDPMPESEVHAIMNPKDTNNIVISPIRLDDSQAGSDDILLDPVYFTKDFGHTWQKSTFKNIPLRSDIYTVGGGDPMMAYDDYGYVYLSWINEAVKYTGEVSVLEAMLWAYSSDGGNNWNRSSNSTIDQAKYRVKSINNPPEFYDKEWMAADRSNSQYEGNVYLSLTYMSNTSGYNINVYRKGKGAVEFDSQPVRVNHGTYDLVQFSNMDVDNNGYIHVLFYATPDYSANALYHSVSTDGGKTFSQETKITNFTFAGSRMIPGNQNTDYNGLNPQRLYPCPQMAIDKSKSGTKATIYVTWTATGISYDIGNYLDIYLSKSTDGGLTWSTPSVVNDDNKSIHTCQYYSSISVNPNGVLILSWYDRRADPNDRYAYYYMTFSFDGGKTFMQDFKVSTVSTDFLTVGDLNSNFGIGEYNELLSTKGYAIPVWSDGRTNDGNMNIYTAFINISDDPNSVLSVDNLTTINSNISIASISPNPADNKIDIAFNLNKSVNARLFITDLQGQEVKEISNREFIEGEQNIGTDLSGLASGQYYINILSNGALSSKKLIIKK